jgi:hypothetical protein
MTDADRDARAHARIEAALGELGAELSPPVGWQARVLAAVAAPPRRRRWWLALPAALAAAALALVLWRALRPPARADVQLAVAVVRPGAVVRGDTANVGDIVTARALGDAPHRAVWIFRDKRELILACPGSPRCRAADGALIATATLELPGAYAIVALASRAAIPAPTASYDASVAAAEAAGARVRVQALAAR